MNWLRVPSAASATVPRAALSAGAPQLVGIARQARAPRRMACRAQRAVPGDRAVFDDMVDHSGWWRLEAVSRLETSRRTHAGPMLDQLLPGGGRLAVGHSQR